MKRTQAGVPVAKAPQRARILLIDADNIDLRFELFLEFHAVGLVAYYLRWMRYWSDVDDQDIYSLIGEEGFARLVAAFYRHVPATTFSGRCIPADLAGAEERLRDFLIFALADRARYIEERGHPRLRMRHAPFAIGQAARDRWMELMNNALAEAALPADAESRCAISSINRNVHDQPPGLHADLEPGRICCLAVPPRIPFLLLLTVCPALVPAAAQPNVNSAVLAAIPQRMKHFVDDQTVAGAVTLVAHGKDVLEFDAFGMADAEAGHPMRKDTIFQIMSMTKPVTAIGIMMLAEEGKLALRDPVKQYLPEFHNQRVAANSGPDAAQLGTPNHLITIRDLLTTRRAWPSSPPDRSTTTRSQWPYPLPKLSANSPASPCCFSPARNGATAAPGSRSSAGLSKSAPVRSTKILLPPVSCGPSG